MISYDEFVWFSEDFVADPHPSNLLGYLDNCGDPTFGVDTVLHINRSKSSDKIISIIIQNMESREPIKFKLFHNTLTIDMGCGMEIYRSSDHFTINTVSMPI